MHLLICAATTLEIKPTLSFLENNNHPQVQVLITGVGITAATYHLTKNFCNTRPRLVLQAGVAGSFSENLSLGEVVAVEKDTLGDLGVLEQNQFRSVFNLGLANLNELPWENGWLVNKSVALKHIPFLKVNGVTVNQISTSAETINYYKTKLGATVETMEGAALHYVCLLENLPFLQLRSISNHAGERNKSKWKMKEAIENLNDALLQMITKTQIT